MSSKVRTLPLSLGSAQSIGKWPGTPNHIVHVTASMHLLTSRLAGNFHWRQSGLLWPQQSRLPRRPRWRSWVAALAGLAQRRGGCRHQVPLPPTWLRSGDRRNGGPETAHNPLATTDLVERSPISGYGHVARMSHSCAHACGTTAMNGARVCLAGLREWVGDGTGGSTDLDAP